MSNNFCIILFLKYLQYVNLRYLVKILLIKFEGCGCVEKSAEAFSVFLAFVIQLFAWKITSKFSEKFTDKCMENWKYLCTLVIVAIFFTFDQYYILPGILSLRTVDILEIKFYGNYLTWSFYTNIVFRVTVAPRLKLQEKHFEVEDINF